MKCLLWSRESRDIFSALYHTLSVRDNCVRSFNRHNAENAHGRPGTVFKRCCWGCPARGICSVVSTTRDIVLCTTSVRPRLVNIFLGSLILNYSNTHPSNFLFEVGIFSRGFRNKGNCYHRINFHRKCAYFPIGYFC